MDSFAEDVKKGLSAEQKYLPSKYFYDEQGSKLFQAIMNLDEYYPTRCEAEVLDTHKDEMCRIFTEGEGGFQLVELGAGDGLKTRILLHCFDNAAAELVYLPIDISPTILVELTHSVNEELPAITTGAITGDYFEALAMLKRYDSKRRILLFLGSTIGNFTKKQAIDFLSELRKQMNSNDLLMIGFDLQKHPKVIAAAYNDKQGVTRDFNLNLLHRINRELGGDVNIEQFEHYPVYDPSTGEAKSYIVSSVEQTVNIQRLDASFHFRAGEAIYTEISRKYTIKGIEELAKRSGFAIVKNFTDSKAWFVDTIWKTA